MDHHSKAKKPGKARIPDHLRRRALVSCDRCKKRRIRCSRSSGTDANEPCQSCLEVGANCESTLPRKTRIYGSVETLSVRYRVLDALIKGLYPDKDTNSLESLYAIAEAHEIVLPTFDEQTVAEEVFHQPQKHIASSPQQSIESMSSPTTTSKESEIPDASEARVEKVVEEKLVPMPHGPSHYIGPSSSFGFVLTVRNMVADLTAALRTIHPDDERTKISSEFGGSNWSKALEPITKDESDSSEDNVDRRSMMGDSSIAGRRSRGSSLFPGSVGSNTNPRSKNATVLSVLPEKHLTDTFVEAFFEHVHPNYLLFHRPTFQVRYDSMWSQPHVLMKDIQQGWICCLFMILVFGAQVLEDHDKNQSTRIQRVYLGLVQTRMHQLISATTLVNVQAILLLQLYQHNCTERNSAFMLLGCASRMAMALGMHREGTSGGFDEMEKEIRKRVWWTTYMFEQTQCAILGRPCAIDDSEVNITFPDELKLDGGLSVPQGYIEYSVQLSKLLSDIRRKIYAVPTNLKQQGESPKIPVAVQCLVDLDTWHRSLPPALRVDSLTPLPKHRRAVLLLHVQFHHTQSLVTRPFLLRKVGVQLARQLGRHVRSQDLDVDELNLSSACGRYSRESTLLLHQMLLSGMFDGVAWLDAFYVYQSVFILALDFLARPWDEVDTEEDMARKKAVRDVMGALQNVKLCPTYTILTQVALQLSKIVGILDASSDQLVKSEEYRRYMEQQQATFTFDYSPPQNMGAGGVGGSVIQNWFQKEPVDLPWELKDFFATDSYIGPTTTGPTMASGQQAFQSGMPVSMPPPYSQAVGMGQQSGMIPRIEGDLLGGGVGGVPGVGGIGGVGVSVPPYMPYSGQWAGMDNSFLGQASNRGSGSGAVPGPRGMN